MHLRKHKGSPVHHEVIDQAVAPAFQRSSRRHVKSAKCEYAEVTVNGQQLSVCVVCGAGRATNAEQNKVENDAFLPLPDAAVEPVSSSKLPRNKLVVLGQETPCEGVLHALTVSFERAGQSVALPGPVRVSVPIENLPAFRLYCMDGGMLTELQFTYENGILSFETEQAGLFLPAEVA